MQGVKQAVEIEFLGGSIVGGVAYLSGREVGRWNGGDFYLEPGNDPVIAAARVAKKERDEVNAQIIAATEEVSNTPVVPVKPVKGPKAVAGVATDPDAPTSADADLQAQLDALNAPK